MDKDEQLFWESLNYVLAIAFLGVIAMLQSYQRRQRQRRYLENFSA